MNVVIDQQTIEVALHLHDQGQYAEAYMALALAGDNYSAAALGIVGDYDNIFKGTVQGLWEQQQPGSVSTNWDNVAGRHLFNYLTYINENGGNLPDTLFIEESYRRVSSPVCLYQF